MELRPYQKKAVTAIEKDFKNNQRVLLVMATGCGKTIVFSRLAKDFVNHGGRVLILAHREELLYQAQQKLSSACGIDSSVEKAEMTAAEDSPVVIASIQTLSRDARLSKYPDGSFDLLIVDEAHHSISSTYAKVLTHFSKAKVLGVTATPDRADHRTLANIYDKISFEYDLPQAIKEHFLANIHVRTIPLKLDISDVKVVGGDFQASGLGHAIEPYLDKIADFMAKECRGRHTIVFLPLVEVSQDFAKRLNERGLRAAEIHAGSEDRAEVLQTFHEGKLDVICNAMLLTEGFDEPIVDCIVPLRPTKSRTLFAQMVGRGTRLAEGKDHMLLLDFLWQTERHDLFQPSELIAPNMSIAHQMMNRIRGFNGGYDLTDALTQVLRENADKEQKDFTLVDLAKKLGKLELSIFKPTFKWEKDNITKRQKSALKNFGVDTKFIKTKGLASAMLSTLIERSQQHLATLRQIRYLEENGFVKVCNWTFSQASQMISAIGKNGGVPDGIDVKTYVPEESPSAKEPLPHPSVRLPKTKSKSIRPVKKETQKLKKVVYGEQLAFIKVDDEKQAERFLKTLARKNHGDMPIMICGRNLYCASPAMWPTDNKEIRMLLSNHFKEIHFYKSSMFKSYINFEVLPNGSTVQF